MEVELLVSRGGPSGDFVRGQIITVDDAEALRMIEKGQAKAVKKPEKAKQKKAIETRA